MKKLRKCCNSCKHYNEFTIINVDKYIECKKDIFKTNSKYLFKEYKLIDFNLYKCNEYEENGN